MHIGTRKGRAPVAMPFNENRIKKEFVKNRSWPKVSAKERAIE
jgi:hypothetical protein